MTAFNYPLREIIGKRQSVTAFNYPLRDILRKKNRKSMMSMIPEEMSHQIAVVIKSYDCHMTVA